MRAEEGRKVRPPSQKEINTRYHVKPVRRRRVEKDRGPWERGAVAAVALVLENFVSGNCCEWGEASLDAQKIWPAECIRYYRLSSIIIVFFQEQFISPLG